jgi:hypothetical protein
MSAGNGFTFSVHSAHTSMVALGNASVAVSSDRVSGDEIIACETSTAAAL